MNALDVIELDYAAGSIGVDLMMPVKVNRIELQPNSPLHRVTKAAHIRLYSSTNNVDYTRITGWKLVSKGKGKLEIVMNTPVTARFLKVKSMLDDRDDKFEPVNVAQFKNVPQDLIRVYYLMTSRVEDYSYDKVGNRLTETVTQRYPVARTYTYYPNSSRLKSNGKYSFEYDANGNLVKKETVASPIVTWLYTYDLFNRLLKVAKDGQTVSEYMYDESGLRIKKQGPNSAIYYAFDTGGNVLYEQEDRQYLSYIYIAGKHFARIDGNLDNSITKKYFYHTDHLGSTVLVTDEAGQQVYSSEYTPFGKQVSKEGELDRVAKFTGKDLDEDTGLYYFNARWYDQEIGRFISEDSVPISPEEPSTLNLYTYVENNPIIYTDSSGHNIDQKCEELLSKSARQLVDETLYRWLDTDPHERFGMTSGVEFADKFIMKLWYLQEREHILLEDLSVEKLDSLYMQEVKEQSVMAYTNMIVAFSMYQYQVQVKGAPTKNSSTENGNAGPEKRPSWRQSEKDVVEGTDYQPQKSFKNREGVPYGTKGSVRPEGYKPGSSIEVKNYNVTTTNGQNSLVNNVTKQYTKRVTNLPAGTKQTVVIDVRGQNVSNQTLMNIKNRIISKVGQNIEIIFRK